MKKSVAFFTKYTADIPVSNCRAYAQKHLLEANGFVCHYYSLYSHSASQKWYETGKEAGAISVFFAMLKRMLQLLFMKANDIAVVEYPLLPGTSFRLQKWLLRKQKSVVTDLLYMSSENTNNDINLNSFLSLSHTVISPNSLLTKRALAVAQNVVVIPTCVQLKEYTPVTPAVISEEEGKMFRIGWTGTAATSHHLLTIKDCFLQLHDLYHIRLVLIGFDKKREKELQGLPYTIYAHNADTDIPLLKTCTTGVLPLPDVSSADTSSIFPMMQYMACGLPVVASSNEVTIGVNHGNDNLFARTPFEWYSCLAAMIQNKEYYKETGEKNRRIAEEFYSVEKTQTDYFSLLLSITN